MHQQHLDLTGTFDEMAVLLPPRARPDAERIEHQSVAWFDRVQLPAERLEREGMRRSETGRGVAVSFPRLSYEATAFWARFSLWYFTFDSVRAEDTAARDLPGFLDEAGRLWRMLHDATPPERFGDPFASALGSLLAELDDLAPAVTANRVRQALRDYLFAAAWEAANRAAGTVPRYDDFLAYFRYGAFYILNLEWVEMSPGAFLAEEARRRPEVRAVRAAICDLMTLTNHLCSAPVDARRGVGFGPAPAHGGPGSGGYREHCLEKARTVAQVRDACASDPELGVYCAAAADWAAGTLLWHRWALAHRYRLPDAAAGNLACGRRKPVPGGSCWTAIGAAAGAHAPGRLDERDERRDDGHGPRPGAQEGRAKRLGKVKHRASLGIGDGKLVNARFAKLKAGRLHGHSDAKKHPPDITGRNGIRCLPHADRAVRARYRKVGHVDREVERVRVLVEGVAAGGEAERGGPHRVERADRAQPGHLGRREYRAAASQREERGSQCDKGISLVMPRPRRPALEEMPSVPHV
jgi:hypothetical protein